MSGRRTFQAEGTSKCKGPAAGACVGCLRNCVVLVVTGGEKAVGGEVGSEVRAVAGARAA